jgi:hypothetical protein
MNNYVTSKYYEVFEIHTLPRGLYGLTLRITETTTQWIERAGWIRIPKDSLTLFISETKDKPDKANFTFIKESKSEIGKGLVDVFSTTKDFKKIHKQVDNLKVVLSEPNLIFKINGKEKGLYVYGKRYEGKGIYHGIKTEDTITYHLFSDIKGEYKEVINQ